MDSKNLISQRREILEKLRNIEVSCEGIENENNSKRAQELNLEKGKLISRKNSISSNMSAIESRINSIDNEINEISGSGIEKILNAIKNQRWYFFKNKTKVLMDRDTGYLWANLDYFPYKKENNYDHNEVNNIIKNYDFDGVNGFRIPDPYELWNMIEDKTFPFKEGDYYRIKCLDLWYVNYDEYSTKDLSWSGATSHIYYGYGNLLPCSDFLVKNKSYQKDVAKDNKIFSDNEKAQMTLSLFVENGFEPIFDDSEITELYRKIYIEKPQLLDQLNNIQSRIDSLDNKRVLSSEFEYESMLTKYDINSIDNSIIKYYEAIQKWTNELIDLIEVYEKEKEDIIQDFNTIGLKLSREYEPSNSLTDDENKLLEKRQRYFSKNLSLGMNSVKRKILAVKEDADNLEYRIDEIDNGTNPIRELGLIANEPRAEFSLIAENTAKIIRNALKKIEYFEENHDFVMYSINVWEKWTEDYKVFKTTLKEDLKTASEEDGIEEEIWNNWYDEWQNKRFIIEEKVQPVIEKGLKNRIEMLSKNDDAIKLMINALEKYKDDIDNFYLEERKGIYQKYAFVPGGELQEKFESESILYRYVSGFNNNIQDIIFKCKNTEDRIFVLKWANNILDIQIDEVLTFIADNDLNKISKKILEGFAELKKKNYDIYLSDAKAYGEEKARRDKEYNSLMFKMRKDLLK